MPRGSYYKGEEDVDLNNSGSLKEDLQVGKVDEAELGMVKRLLQECRIDTDESSDWKCQDWVLEGLDRLRAEGFADQVYTRDVVKNWPKERQGAV